MEKIISICEHTQDGNDGFLVETNNRKIFVGISNGQSCCEMWGYFHTLDNLQEFDGATLTDINIVDTALNVKKLDEQIGYGLNEGACLFVNFETDKGTFQLTAYNEHNGYYGHQAVITSTDNSISHEEYL